MDAPVRDESGRHVEPTSQGSRAYPAAGSATIDPVRTTFLDLYDEDYPCAVAFMITCGATRQDAEDAVQEAFLESWKLLLKDPQRWGLRIENHNGWIRRVAVRRYHRPPGPRRRVQTVPASELVDGVEPAPGRIETAEATIAALDVLFQIDDWSARAVIGLDLDGFSTRECAEILDLSEQRIRDLRKKAHRQLLRIPTWWKE